MDYIKQQMLKAELEDVNEKNLFIIGERYKVKNWWASIIIPGLGQMLQGRIGRGIAIWLSTGLLAIILIGLIIYIWGIYDAYNFESQTNNYIDFQIMKKRKELKLNN